MKLLSYECWPCTANCWCLRNPTGKHKHHVTIMAMQLASVWPAFRGFRLCRSFPSCPSTFRSCSHFLRTRNRSPSRRRCGCWNLPFVACSQCRIKNRKTQPKKTQNAGLDIEMWQNGDNLHMRYSYRSKTCYLLVNRAICNFGHLLQCLGRLSLPPSEGR